MRERERERELFLSIVKALKMEGTVKVTNGSLTDQVDCKKVKKKVSLDLATERLFLTFIPMVSLNC